MAHLFFSTVTNLHTGTPGNSAKASSYTRFDGHNLPIGSFPDFDHLEGMDRASINIYGMLFLVKTALSSSVIILIIHEMGAAQKPNENHLLAAMENDED